MKKILCLSFALLWICSSLMAQKPWDNGKLKVSENGRYLQHENGTPFFWLGRYFLLLFQRLNRRTGENLSRNRKAKASMSYNVYFINSIPIKTLMAIMALQQ